MIAAIDAATLKAALHKLALEHRGRRSADVRHHLGNLTYHAGADFYETLAGLLNAEAGVAALGARMEGTDWAASNAQRFPCLAPPAGWYCTRNGGHEGPCAAKRSLDNKAGRTPEPASYLDDEQTARGLCACKTQADCLANIGHRCNFVGF